MGFRFRQQGRNVGVFRVVRFVPFNPIFAVGLAAFVIGAFRFNGGHVGVVKGGNLFFRFLLFGHGLFVQDAGGFDALGVHGPGFVGLGLFRFDTAGNGGNLLFALLNRGAYRLGLFNQLCVGFLAFHQFGNIHGFGVFLNVARGQLFGHRVNESGKRLDVPVYAGSFVFQRLYRFVNFGNPVPDLFGQ